MLAVGDCYTLSDNFLPFFCDYLLLFESKPRPKVMPAYEAAEIREKSLKKLFHFLFPS
jgi:hypothetical protein